MFVEDGLLSWEMQIPDCLTFCMRSSSPVQVNCRIQGNDLSCDLEPQEGDLGNCE